VLIVPFFSGFPCRFFILSEILSGVNGYQS